MKFPVRFLSFAIIAIMLIGAFPLITEEAQAYNFIQSTWSYQGNITNDGSNIKLTNVQREGISMANHSFPSITKTPKINITMRLSELSDTHGTLIMGFYEQRPTDTTLEHFVTPESECFIMTVMGSGGLRYFNLYHNFTNLGASSPNYISLNTNYNIYMQVGHELNYSYFYEVRIWTSAGSWISPNVLNSHTSLKPYDISNLTQFVISNSDQNSLVGKTNGYFTSYSESVYQYTITPDLSFNNRMNMNTNLKIVGIGDSLTAGAIHTDDPTNNYEYYLRTGLNDNKYDSSSGVYNTVKNNSGLSDVINQGHGGEQTYEMWARFNTDVLSEKPSIVIILGGTNDVRLHTAGPGPQPTIKYLTYMYNAAIKNGITIVACTIPANNNLDAQGQSDLEELNRWINLTASGDPEHFIFFDLWDSTVNKAATNYIRGDLVEADGLHFNKAGYKKFGEELALKIETSFIQNHFISGDSIYFKPAVTNTGSISSSYVITCPTHDAGLLWDDPNTGILFGEIHQKENGFSNITFKVTTNGQEAYYNITLYIWGSDPTIPIIPKGQLSINLEGIIWVIIFFLPIIVFGYFWHTLGVMFGTGIMAIVLGLSDDTAIPILFVGLVVTAVYALSIRGGGD